jgi:hypothetical protein
LSEITLTFEMITASEWEFETKFADEMENSGRPLKTDASPVQPNTVKKRQLAEPVPPQKSMPEPSSSEYH